MNRIYGVVLVCFLFACSSTPEAESVASKAKTSDAGTPVAKTSATLKKTKRRSRRRKKLKLPLIDPPPRLPSRYHEPINRTVGPEHAPDRKAGSRTTSTGPQTKSDLDAIAKSAALGQVPSVQGAPPIERLDENRLAVGRVIVDRKKRQVEVKCHVAMTQGILEYLVVGPRGKAYETVLTHEGLASQVHLSLLLIGLTPKARGGSKVEMWYRWVDSKTQKTKTVRAEQWLVNRSLRKSPAPQTWRFTGSSFWNGRYAGDSSYTLISLIKDPNAVIVLEDDSGNPYRGDHLGYEVYKEKTPPKDTEVTLIIKPAKTP
jgi:hypothetical protein